MDASRRSFLVNVAAGGTALALFGRAQPVEAAAGPSLIDWLGWQDGLQRAATEHKAIGLLIYADWCPHCRELQPVWRDPETVRASRALVMIRQNADEQPAWLPQRFGQFGTYVPRMFFLRPDGTMAPEIQSGNPKYPYFYTPQHAEALHAAMKRAAGLGQKH